MSRKYFERRTYVDPEGHEVETFTELTRRELARIAVPEQPVREVFTYRGYDPRQLDEMIAFYHKHEQGVK